MCLVIPVHFHVDVRVLLSVVLWVSMCIIVFACALKWFGNLSMFMLVVVLVLIDYLCHCSLMFLWFEFQSFLVIFMHCLWDLTFLRRGCS
jgi:hypothetical protein